MSDTIYPSPQAINRQRRLVLWPNNAITEMTALFDDCDEATDDVEQAVWCVCKTGYGGWTYVYFSEFDLDAAAN
jgi:hypothetical protein